MAYSHNGCQRCKKVRVKCDEGSPSCKLCLKKGVDCVYDFSILVYDPTQHSKKSRRRKQIKKLEESSSSNQSPTSSTKEKEKEVSVPNDKLKVENERETEEFEKNLKNLHINNNTNVDLSKHSSPFLPNPSFATNTNFLQNSQLMERGLIIDASLFDSEDKRILSAILPNHTFSDTSSTSTQDKLSIYSLSPPNALPSPANEASLQFPDFTVDWCKNDFSEYIQMVRKIDPLTDHQNDTVDEWDPKFQRYIWDTFTKTKCMLNYLYVIDDSQNYLVKAMKTLAPTNPIIGYTVNAIAANLLDFFCQDSRWRVIRTRNMNICIKILARQIATANDFVSMSCLLISVMFLYSERSASKTNLWRLHLKGALGILQKCESMYLSIIHNSKTSQQSNELLSCGIDLYFFAKNWFIAAETIAWLSAPNGGCITDLEVSKNLLNDPNCFYNSHGVLIGNFNTIKCCSQNLIPIFNRIVEVIMWLKLNYGINLGGFYVIKNINHPNFNQEIKKKLTEIGKDLLIQIAMLHNEDLNLHDIKDQDLASSIVAADYVVKHALKNYIRIVFLQFNLYDPKITSTLIKMANHLDKSKFPYGESIGVGIHWSVYYSALISSPQSGLRKSFLNFIYHIVNRGIFVGRNSVERLKFCWDAMDNGVEFSETDFDCIAN